MATFNFELVTPERLLMSGEAEQGAQLLVLGPGGLRGDQIAMLASTAASTPPITENSVSRLLASTDCAAVSAGRARCP